MDKYTDGKPLDSEIIKVMMDKGPEAIAQVVTALASSEAYKDPTSFRKAEVQEFTAQSLIIEIDKIVEGVERKSDQAGPEIDKIETKKVIKSTAMTILDGVIPDKRMLEAAADELADACVKIERGQYGRKDRIIDAVSDWCSKLFASEEKKVAIDLASKIKKGFEEKSNNRLRLAPEKLGVPTAAKTNNPPSRGRQ
ncbi:MAG: hypothetical protein V4485_05615 [Pseudomonadota bacterium]